MTKLDINIMVDEVRIFLIAGLFALLLAFLEVLIRLVLFFSLDLYVVSVPNIFIGSWILFYLFISNLRRRLRR